MVEISLEVLLDWAGYLGVAFYIGSYICLQLGWIPGVGYTYAFLNLLGALLVLLSLYYAFNMASALIQLSWIVISVVGITRTFLISRRLFFTHEEEDFVQSCMPGIPKEAARRILDAGNWLNVDASVHLTDEGKPVTQLFYIAQGKADVLVGGNSVAMVDHGFIGEINVMAGDPASATVVTLERTRVFCIAGESLRNLVRGDSQTAWHLEMLLAASTKQKLMQANMKLSSAPKATEQASL